MGDEIYVLLKSCMSVAKQAAKNEWLAEHKYSILMDLKEAIVLVSQSEDDSERKVKTEEWYVMTTNVYLLKIKWTVMPYHNHIRQSGRHSPAPRRTGNWQECMCGQTNTQTAPGHMCPLDF